LMAYPARKTRIWFRGSKLYPKTSRLPPISLKAR
jgi:hypothetical protein